MNKSEIPEIPLCLDTTVLPEVDPKRLTLFHDWVYFEGEVILRDEDYFDVKNDANVEEIDVNGRMIKCFKNRLKNFEDIKEGDIIYSTWYDEEIVGMKIENIDKDKQTAIGKLSDFCHGGLCFNKDSRKCWVCSGYVMINSEAIVKLEIS